MSFFGFLPVGNTSCRAIWTPASSWSLCPAIPVGAFMYATSNTHSRSPRHADAASMKRVAPKLRAYAYSLQLRTPMPLFFQSGLR